MARITLNDKGSIVVPNGRMIIGAGGVANPPIDPDAIDALQVWYDMGDISTQFNNGLGNNPWTGSTPELLQPEVKSMLNKAKSLGDFPVRGTTATCDLALSDASVVSVKIGLHTDVTTINDFAATADQAWIDVNDSGGFRAIQQSVPILTNQALLQPAIMNGRQTRFWVFSTPHDETTEPTDQVAFSEQGTGQFDRVKYRKSSNTIAYRDFESGSHDDTTDLWVPRTAGTSRWEILSANCDEDLDTIDFYRNGLFIVHYEPGHRVRFNRSIYFGSRFPNPGAGLLWRQKTGEFLNYLKIEIDY